METICFLGRIFFEAVLSTVLTVVVAVLFIALTAFAYGLIAIASVFAFVAFIVYGTYQIGKEKFIKLRDRWIF